MTRQDLEIKIKHIQKTYMPVEYDTIQRNFRQDILQLIDLWTAEIIGEDESMVGEYGDELHDIITRNLERDEARTRAGLSTKGGKE